MASGTENPIRGVDLTDDEYTIRRHLVRNGFEVFDVSGRLVLRARKERPGPSEEFRFDDADGNAVFAVKAVRILDRAGDYALTTPEGTDVAVLGRKSTLLLHRWKIRDPHTGELLAVVESEGSVVDLARNATDLFAFLPDAYTIEAPDGTGLGELKGKLSLHEEYILRIFDGGELPREVLTACAIAVDLLEGS